MDVVIRAPKIEDAQGLAQAARDMGEQYAAHEPERFHVPDAKTQVDWFREVLRKPPPENSIWLVAEVDGEAVGDAQAVLSEPAPTAAIQPQLDVGRKRVYLNWLAVQERWRGHGVGGRLLDAIESWAREHGAELIATDTNLRSNVGAVEFYERHGYERQAVILRKSLR
jgi:GNAT superfamily N-acetyltransferase